jgi:NAD-dependent SIR2 family protein deacetylase
MEFNRRLEVQMQIGTDQISTRQHRYLDQIRDEPRVRIILEFLGMLIQDENILAGREQIHPDWIPLFETHKDSLRRVAPSSLWDRLNSFFEKLTPFDRSLEDLDPKSLNLSFLLGAGASKPEPSNIPTVKELLPQLLERARRLDREDVTKLADFCDSRKIDNIEDLLTAAHIATFSSRNPTVLELMNYLLYRSVSDEPYRISRFADPRGIDAFEYGVPRRYRDSAADMSSVAFLQDTLQVLFGLLSSTMLPARPNPAHNAIATYVKEHPRSLVVTTNYDCCMDLALGEVRKDFQYCIEFTNVATSYSAEENCTRLIKLHGSLNWFYCETCQEVQLVDIRQTMENFLEDRAPYPVIGICKDCGGQRRGLLVPPLAMKFDLAPPLTPLTGEAKIAFEVSDLIVVVGFSFADADIYISRMLSKSMQTKPDQKLLVVDPDNHVVEKVRRKFKASIPNFDAARIIRMTGDCSDVLPKFLTGQLLRSSVDSLDGSGTRTTEDVIVSADADQ